MKRNHSNRKMSKRLLFTTAIATIALVISGCLDGGLGGDDVGDKQPDKPGTVQTGIKVYFHNGWEAEVVGTTKLATAGLAKQSVTPEYINAVIGEADSKAYNDTLDIIREIKDLWVQYDKDMEAFFAGEITIQPAQPEDIPSDPIAPSPTLPYFPGSPFIANAKGNTDTFGTKPELQGKTIVGWELWPDYDNPSVEKNNGAVPLTLTTVLSAQSQVDKTLTGTYHAVAVWADAGTPPSLPDGTPAGSPAPTPYLISFERNDGTGYNEIRLAYPTEVWFKAREDLQIGGIVAGSGIVDDPQLGYRITKDKTSAAAVPEFAKYGKYIVQATTNTEGKGFPATEPVYTRTFWRTGGWLDITGKVSVTEPVAATAIYAGDTYIFQKWDPVKWKIDFEMGRADSDASSPSIVGAPSTGYVELDAPKLAEGGFAAAGLIELPKATASTLSTDGIDQPAGKYTFSNWNTAQDYSGQSIGLNTPIQPAFKVENNITVIDDTKPLYGKLYAQWNIAGTVSFNISGVKVKEFKVPATADYKLELWGAAGSVGGWTDATGADLLRGKGGYISGTVHWTAGDVYYIYIGGKPRDGGNRFWRAYGEGGFNGGGTPGDGHNTGTAGGRGGGATDIRKIKVASEDQAATDPVSLASRIIVAGGGGGGDWWSMPWAEPYGGNGGVGIARGGDGKGLTVHNVNTPYWVTNSGGPLSESDTVFNGYKVKGQGQGSVWPSESGDGRYRASAGGGGGGYYGGATPIVSPTHTVGGGGGSSWANAQNKPGYSSSLDEITNVYNIVDGTGKGTWLGAGKVKITYTPPPVAP